MTIRIGIFGATGYTGFELVKILQRHPEAVITLATARSSAGQTLDTVFPAAPPLPLVSEESADLSLIDLAFLCLPHAAAAETAMKCLDASVKVIDLSADFRLKSAQSYQEWYGHQHPAPQLLEEAIYGLTEWARDRLPNARLIANPGCYPTSILLPTLPLLRADVVTGPIIADSKSGVSGAGRAPSVTTHFVEVADNFGPYKIGRTHRHLPEIEQEMKLINQNAPTLIFSPHLLPVPRGILSTIYVPTSANETAIRELLQQKYEGEPFVRVLPKGQMASLAHVTHTNRCVISLSMAGNMAILVSAEDNLIKGASGQAVQNMNAVYGFPETMGLL